MQKGLEITITSPKGYRRKVGCLILAKNGRIFHKVISRKKHFMRVVGGYGIQKKVFDKYLRGKKGFVIIDEIDTGKRWFSRIEDWMERSHSGNYGDGKQIFLGIKYMKSSP